jgi:hypothetical protein
VTEKRNRFAVVFCERIDYASVKRSAAAAALEALPPPLHRSCRLK